MHGTFVDTQTVGRLYVLSGKAHDMSSDRWQAAAGAESVNIAQVDSGLAPKAAWATAFSANGSQVWSWTADNGCTNPATGALRVATGSEDGTIRVWDAETGGALPD